MLCLADQICIYTYPDCIADCSAALLAGLDKHDYNRQLCYDAFQAFKDCRNKVVSANLLKQLVLSKHTVSHAVPAKTAPLPAHSPYHRLTTAYCTYCACMAVHTIHAACSDEGCKLTIFLTIAFSTPPCMSLAPHLGAESQGRPLAGVGTGSISGVDVPVVEDGKA